MGSIFVAPAGALAGNVLVQVECGNPPRVAPTDHEVRVRALSLGELETRGVWKVPEEGTIAGLTIDGRELKLIRPEIRRGFVETEELGRVFLFFSDDAGTPGYSLVVSPEHADRLERR